MRFAKLFACVVLMVCLGVSGWFALANAQEGTSGGQAAPVPVWDEYAPPPDVSNLSWDAALAEVQPYVDLAKAAEQAGNHELAAQRYLSVAGQLPESPQKQEMMLLAATQWDQDGKAADALPLCEQIVGIEKRLIARPYADAGPSDGPRLADVQAKELQRHTYDALRFELAHYHRTGNTEQALRTVRRLRAEFPKGDLLNAVLPVQAALEGKDPQVLAAREEAASEDCGEAMAAFKSNNNAMLYTLTDRVLAEYPDTAAALRARRIKSLALLRDHRYAEERAVAGELMGLIGDVAPDCTLARYTACRMAWWDGCRMTTDLMAKAVRKQATEAEWQQLRNHCQTVMDNALEPLKRLEMNVLLVSAYGWQRDYEKAVQVRDALFEKYNKPEGLRDPVYKRFLIRAELHAGAALQKLKRFDEALQAYQWIVEVEGQQPLMTDELSSLPETYFRIWASVRAKGASAEDIGRAAQDVLSRFPDTVYAKAVKRHMSEEGAVEE